MQKIIVGVLILALFLTAGCSVEGIAEDSEKVHDSDCPHGEVNCKYPGNCSKYVDINNDICDHSE